MEFLWKLLILNMYLRTCLIFETLFVTLLMVVIDFVCMMRCDAGYGLMLVKPLSLSWRMSLSYRHQSIDLQGKSMNRFLYNRDLRHERINVTFSIAVNFDNVISASYAHSKCAFNQFRELMLHFPLLWTLIMLFQPVMHTQNALLINLEQSRFILHQRYSNPAWYIIRK